MRVMVFHKASEGGEGSETGMAPTPETIEAFKAMDQFTEELVKAGVFVAAAGLKNSAQARRVVFDGPGRTVIDGPFAETRELVVGFSIWEVKDMDEAMAWVNRCPNPTMGKGELEIRPFFEAADLAEFRDGGGALDPPGRGAGKARRRLIPSARASPSLGGHVTSFGSGGRLVLPLGLGDNAV